MMTEEEILSALSDGYTIKETTPESAKKLKGLKLRTFRIANMGMLSLLSKSEKLGLKKTWMLLLVGKDKDLPILKITFRKDNTKHYYFLEEIDSMLKSKLFSKDSFAQVHFVLHDCPDQEPPLTWYHKLYLLKPCYKLGGKKDDGHFDTALALALKSYHELSKYLPPLAGEDTNSKNLLLRKITDAMIEEYDDSYKLLKGSMTKDEATKIYRDLVWGEKD